MVAQGAVAQGAKERHPHQSNNDSCNQQRSPQAMAALTLPGVLLKMPARLKPANVRR